MKTKLFILAGLLFFYNSATGQVPDSLKYISLRPVDFQKAYQNSDKAVLIDVREFFEYRKSRLEDAVNIPSSGNLQTSADTLSKESSLFLYCTSGFRSRKVARYFFDRGFIKPYSLDGGIIAWKKEGLPVNKKKVRKK
jgi:rhodanese-related sulfurtransferase